MVQCIGLERLELEVTEKQSEGRREMIREAGRRQESILPLPRERGPVQEQPWTRTSDVYSRANRLPASPQAEELWALGCLVHIGAQGLMRKGHRKQGGVSPSDHVHASEGQGKR